MYFFKVTASGDEYLYEMHPDEIQYARMKNGGQKAVAVPRQEKAWRYSCYLHALRGFGIGWCAIAKTPLAARTMVALKRGEVA